MGESDSSRLGDSGQLLWWSSANVSARTCPLFCTLCSADGTLIFNQSTFSWHLSKKGWDADEHKLESFLTALSSKRIQVVVCPDVENCFVLWVKHMEERKETVNGAMLIAKCEKFENALKVLEKERMISNGWISKFYKAYVWIIPSILNRCWSNAHSGMVSKNTNDMVKWDQWMLKLWNLRGREYQILLLSIHQRIIWILTKVDCFPCRLFIKWTGTWILMIWNEFKACHQIGESLLSKYQAKRETSSRSWSCSWRTHSELKSGPPSLLVNGRSHSALARRDWTSRDFIITITRLPGQPGNYLKSEFVSDKFWPYLISHQVAQNVRWSIPKAGLQGPADTWYLCSTHESILSANKHQTQVFWAQHGIICPTAWSRHHLTLKGSLL